MNWRSQEEASLKLRRLLEQDHPRVLVRRHHRRRLPEPPDHRDSEEGDRRFNLHRLGGRGGASGRGHHSHDLLPAAEEDVRIPGLRTPTDVPLPGGTDAQSWQLWSGLRPAVEGLFWNRLLRPEQTLWSPHSELWHTVPVAGLTWPCRNTL